MAWLFTNIGGLTGSTTRIDPQEDFRDDISKLAVQLQCESSCLVKAHVVFAPFHSGFALTCGTGLLILEKPRRIPFAAPEPFPGDVGGSCRSA